MILVFAGHSGGHLFPAQAFAEVYRSSHPTRPIFLITSQKAEPLVMRMPVGVFDGVHYLPEFPFPSGFSLRTLRFLLQLPQAFWISSRLISQYQPKLCVGFGSYVSYPGLLLAAWRRIPAMIHEQNVIPGIATRALAPHVDCVAVSFNETLSDGKWKRREITGLPSRAFLRDAAAKHLRLPRKSKGIVTVLVVGGSQGAHRLNEVCAHAFSQFSPEEKKKIAVIHITGENDSRWVEKKYSEEKVVHEVHPFHEKMHELYARVDFAVTRAGANTLFELALFQLPAVVVPYPFAGGHQGENAASFAKDGGLIIREEKDFTSEWLAKQVLHWWRSPEELAERAKEIASHATPQAAEKMAVIAAEIEAGSNACLSLTQT